MMSIRVRESRKCLHLLGILALGLFSTASNAALIHQYELNGTYADSLGTGPDLQPLGTPTGTFNAENTQYIFGANKGLRVQDGGGKFVLPGNDGHYSIVLDFKFDDLNGYRKIIDFKGLTTDPGMYVYSAGVAGPGEPYFFGGTGFPPNEKNPAEAIAMTPGVFTRLVVTRDDTNNRFDAYFNGTRFINFFDTSDLAVFSFLNGPMNFFIDDRGLAEASAGAVDRIWIYDAPLSQGEITDLENNLGQAGLAAVPEPSTMALSTVGFGAFYLLHRRKRKTQSTAQKS